MIWIFLKLDISWVGDSVARTFSSEIADFSQIYRQIRQVFGSNSRKIRQFLPTFNVKIDPSTPKISILIAFLCINNFQNPKS